MRNGTCVGALMGYTDATVVLAESCDMQLTTTRIFPSGGSFVFQTDETRCGPTILKLIDYHLVQLAENGMLDELWSKQILSYTCEFNAADLPKSEDDFIRLGLQDLGGLCTIYAIVAIVSLIGSSIGYCYGKKTIHEAKETEMATSAKNENERTANLQSDEENNLVE
eukprot:UN01339